MTFLYIYYKNYHKTILHIILQTSLNFSLYHNTLYKMLSRKVMINDRYLMYL